MPDEDAISAEPAALPAPTATEVSTEEATPMLDVHPAHHAASSWKEFFVHIATICIGLLIAIGLEQTVEYIHLRRELTDARRELAEEKNTNIRIYHRNRASFQEGRAKIELYLAQIRATLGRPGTPLPVFNMPVGFRFHVYTAWTIAQRGSALTLMSPAEQSANDRIYVSMHTLDEHEEQVYEQLEHIRAVFLADPNPVHVTHEQALAMYRDLSEALADVDNLADVETITEQQSPEFK